MRVTQVGSAWLTSASTRRVAPWGKAALKPVPRRERDGSIPSFSAFPDPVGPNLSDGDGAPERD